MRGNVLKIICICFPRISLHCKLVPVQYWEYEYGLLKQLEGRSLKNIRASTGSPDIFQASSFQLLKLEIYCDNHSSLSSTTAVKYEFHIYFAWKPCWLNINQLTKEVTNKKSADVKFRYQVHHYLPGITWLGWFCFIWRVSHWALTHYFTSGCRISLPRQLCHPVTRQNERRRSLLGTIPSRGHHQQQRPGRSHLLEVLWMNK